MANESRQATRKVIELADEGVLTWEQVARDCMNYMSEDEVADMARGNDYFEGFQEEEDEDE
jgi:hypothetical protein